ncbi:MAG: sulfite reductase subunit A [Elusimicrobia bacterium RIFCSPLOWO2_01_FULL_64_13]|nr:MAG: sulfite reductase subunit A [Elusimicrobia bacterium RIFCSPLOWO2_01_FULL_64_13]
MENLAVQDSPAALLRREGLEALVRILRAGGYRVLGPVLKDSAVVYDELESLADLPEGLTDEQSPGSYRVTKDGSRRLFGYAVGPQSPKKYLFPPESRVWSARRSPGGMEFEAGTLRPEKLAFLGVRPCELAAISIQDRVFLGGRPPDPAYKARRGNVFLISVNCARPGGTCFCGSMGTGPEARTGYDLSLTEFDSGNAPAYLARSGSDAGRRVLDSIPRDVAGPGDIARAKKILDDARGRMGRSLETDGIRETLPGRSDHPRWEITARRCLTCANCTMVCPTCFCSTFEDSSDLSGNGAERVRKWDSCFTMDFSYIHGGSVRRSAASRYRQWLTHKFAWWHEQFGTSGCVGCGRCITWCPVGIDVTEEIRAVCRGGGPEKGAKP